MELVLSKQATKFLQSADAAAKKKLGKALTRLKDAPYLPQPGLDIKPLSGHKGLYRYKVEHYRIVFHRNGSELILYIIEINTRTNIKYREY